MEHNPTTTTTTGARLTTLDPSAGHITTVNIYTVTPERSEEVLRCLIRSAEETVRYVPGFLSFNFHLSRPHPDRQLRTVGEPRDRHGCAHKPDDRRAYGRGDEDRGPFERDALRTPKVRAGGGSPERVTAYGAFTLALG